MTRAFRRIFKESAPSHYNQHFHAQLSVASNVICSGITPLYLGLLGAARGTPRATPIRTSGGGAAPNIKASITRRAADVHGRC